MGFPDLSHVTAWPPQPSTLIGLGLLVGVAVAIMVDPVAAPVLVPLVAGLLGVALPDNTRSNENG